MANPLVQELGLGPVGHRMRRWLKHQGTRLGLTLASQGSDTLDPLSVNYEAWDAVRRHVREWPTYQEAPNSLEVYVSQEDWEDYWGIDTGRKEEGIAAYIAQRADEKGYWMAGHPQVIVTCDDDLDIGQVDISWQFVEPADGRGKAVSGDTAEHEALAKDEAVRPRFADAATAGEARLVGEGGFCLTIRSGDCIGAVRQGEAVPAEVNIRLDGEGFAYAAPKQCSVGVIDGDWMVLNHAPHGTMVVTAQGQRLVLGDDEPYPLAAGDRIFVGLVRPLRFDLADGAGVG